MGKSLVVVESPAKAKTIEKFLGRKYRVMASMGHLRDLPKSQFGIDVENSFQPKYINIRGKGQLINSLKSAAKEADQVLLATDPDREGEAIAWHLAHLLNVNENGKCRIEFNEITKASIQEAVKKPRPVNVNRVNAQQTRRILDRIVGYKLSPLLWKKIRKGLSAGRVQSVAVRLICDREKEIQAFKAEEYWTITAKLRPEPKGTTFEAEVVKHINKKLNISNQQQAEEITTVLGSAEYSIANIQRKERKRNPYPPFTTSSLQQESARKLGFAARKTMMIAQQLYEGLNIGSQGHVGLITYMRTDSVRIADIAKEEARAYIADTFGAEFVPERPPVYASKSGSQDAHECIRPTSIQFTPDSVKESLTRDQYRLYKLIWSRLIASQMSPAVLDTVSIDIQANDYLLRANGSQVKFKGFMIVYVETKEDDKPEKDIILPDLEVGQRMKLQKLEPDQHFTQPPPRYTEASLVKELEENGIGRPSTYAPIIETIQERNYVLKQEKKFHPTELGMLVMDLLTQHFSGILDVEFTANLETKLDGIAEGTVEWVKVLQEFYHPFSDTLKTAEELIGDVEIPVEVSDEICEYCGRNMVFKHGRYGKFLACPGFPACRNAKPILQPVGVQCPLCSGDIVKRRSKKGRIFYGCKNFPECSYVTWDMPLVNQACPKCGAFLVTGKGKGKQGKVLCSREGCIYQENSKPSQSKREIEKSSSEDL